MQLRDIAAFQVMMHAQPPLELWVHSVLAMGIQAPTS